MKKGIIRKEKKNGGKIKQKGKGNYKETVY